MQRNKTLWWRVLNDKHQVEIAAGFVPVLGVHGAAMKYEPVMRTCFLVVCVLLWRQDIIHTSTNILEMLYEHVWHVSQLHHNFRGQRLR